MNERIAIIDGIRTPMAKAGGKLKNITADELGAISVRELISRLDIPYELYDELIMGNVAQPTHAANVARVIALKSGLPESIIASTVHRNCASGMESLTSCANRILLGRGEVFICGGVESMSNIPLLFNEKMTDFFGHLSSSKTITSKISTFFEFRPSFLKPIVGVMSGLTDPVSGMIMGATAEVLAKDFSISRKEQDEFALRSHKRAAAAVKNGVLTEEIIPIVSDSEKGSVMFEDDGIRADQTIEALAKLRPYFDKKGGTVTVGNSSQLTDSSAALVVMSESKAKDMGLEPLGYLKDYAYAGLDPVRMGLGPIFATHKLLKDSPITMKDIDLIELNEAFAAQVIANIRAFESKEFASTHFGDAFALGKIDEDILNVNGGAIALGHPVGMTGARLVLHTLKELRRRGKQRGLATLCIGGGQGASLLLEVE